MATVTALIRAARKLDFHGALPGTAKVVHDVVNALENERALRIRLQHELNAERKKNRPQEEQDQ
jgi:hypothetical protein